MAPRDRSLNRNVVCLAKKNLDLEDVTEIIRYSCGHAFVEQVMPSGGHRILHYISGHSSLWD